MNDSPIEFFPDDIDAVLLMIRKYGRDHNLTPKQVGEIFQNGIVVGIDCGGLGDIGVFPQPSKAAAV